MERAAIAFGGFVVHHRREMPARLPLVAVLVVLALGISAAGAQSPGTVARVGTLSSAWGPDHPAIEGMKAGLRAMGFEAGGNVVFDDRYTEGDLSALPAAAAALVGQRVDVIFTTDDAAMRAALAATKTVPIVFSTVSDPVAEGFVADIARPGGNVTGVATMSSDLTPKRLEILKGLVPSLRRVWIIYDAGNAYPGPVLARATEAAPRLGVQIVGRSVKTPGDLAQAFREVRPGDGFMSFEQATLLDIPAQMLKQSLARHIPAIFTAAFWGDFGALASYGADFRPAGEQAARLVAKILRGAHPRDVPVEGATRIELMINAKTARAFGLKIPQSLLLRADRVIQ